MKNNIVLNVIMLTVFTVLLCFIFFQHRVSNVDLYNGYCNELSYFPQDSISLYFNYLDSSRCTTTRLFDINGNVIDSINNDAYVQNKQIQPDAWKDGFNYKKCTTYINDNLPSGVYLWEKKVPIIIKSSDSTAVTVVVPSANFQAESNFGGKSFYASTSSNNIPADTLSLLRPMYLDNYSIDFLPWLKNNFNSKPIGYISDLDLEDYTTFNKSKLLIVYGYMSNVTPLMRSNIDKFINKGGNMLVLTSNFLNNILYHDKETKQILLQLSSKHQNAVLWNSASLYEKNYFTSGASYEINLNKTQVHASFGGYKITYHHPIFKNLSLTIGDTIKFDKCLYSSPPVNIKKSIPIIDTSKSKFYNQTILAYDYSTYNEQNSIGTIYLFQKTKESGIVINIGSSDLVKRENLNNKIIATTLKNSINWLIEQ